MINKGTTQYILKRSISIIVFILMFSYLSLAQVDLELSAGLFGFSMQDMKDIQLQIQNEDNIGLKPAHIFPSYFAYSFSLAAKHIDSEEYTTYIGGEVNYTSTGGRLSYSDYSGTYNVDQLLQRVNFGGYYRIMWPITKGYYFGIEIGPSIFFSKTRFESYLRLDDVVVDESSLVFNSAGVNGKIIILNKLIVYKNVYLIAKTGYEVDIYESKLVFEDDSNLYLNDPEGNQAKSMWSGFRATVGIGFSVSK